VHAWDGWIAPVSEGDSGALDTAAAAGYSGADGEESNPDATGNTAVNEAGTARYAKAAQDMDDAFLISLMSGKDKAGAEKDKKKSKADGASAAANTGATKGTKTTLKKPVVLNKACVEAHTKLKAAALALERLTPPPSSSSAPASASASASADSATLPLLAAATNALDVIWAEGVSLKSVVSSTVEEPFLYLLLCVAVHRGATDCPWAAKLAHQLASIDRFATVLQLTLYGNDALKASLRSLVDQLMDQLSTTGGDDKDDSKVHASLMKWKGLL
jgi:hypothetical protein